MDMDEIDRRPITGTGSANADLAAVELCQIVESALEHISPDARVLAIIPDNTRDDNTHILFPAAARVLRAKGTSKIDVLIAQGTHPPMNAAEKLAKIGADLTPPIQNLGEIYDHRWNDTDDLATIGELSANDVSRITDGRFNESIPLIINRRVTSPDYQLILVFGATMPHEVAGFAGGAKYFFPGVAGPELTHKTHWLAALASVENIIGRVETPTRHLIEAAAKHISTPVISFTSVISRTETGRLRTFALFAGDLELALRKAAEISRVVHIKYTGRKYRRVVALLDEHYKDLWVGGKASYRLGGVIEEGGELIIYAPQLTSVSETHGADIIRFGGYKPIDKVREMVETSAELRENLCVAAHLSQVAYAGRKDEDGNFRTRYNIVLASKLDQDTCKQLNLRHLDVADFRLSDYENDPDTLIVDRAGRDLYLVEPMRS